MKTILFTLGLLLFFGHSGAQNHPMHWVSVQGINQPSNQAVYDIVEDSNGFIWLATGSGLFRYDGTRFIRFHLHEKSVNFHGYSVTKLISLPNAIYCLADNQKIISVNIHHLNSELIYLFDPVQEGSPVAICSVSDSQFAVATTKNQVFNFKTDSKIPSGIQHFYKKGYIIQCMKKTKNHLLLGTRGRGLCYFNSEKKYHLTSPSDTFPFPGYSVESILQFNDTLIAYVAWDNAVHFAYPNGINYKYKVFDDRPTIDFKGLEGVSIEKVNDSTVWIGTKANGIYFLNVFSGKSGKIRGQNLNGEKIFCLFRDSKDRIWAGTDEGIQLYDKRMDVFRITELKREEKDEKQLKIHSLHWVDDQIFAGTNAGLMIVRSGSVTSYRLPSEEQEEAIYAMCIYKNSMYLGTARTLYKYDFDSQRISKAIQANIQGRESYSLDPGALLSTRFSILVTDSLSLKSRIIAANPGYGLMIIHPEDNSYMSSGIVLDKTRFAAFIQSILLDDRGGIIAADKATGIYFDVFDARDTLIRSYPGEDGEEARIDSVNRIIFKAQMHADVLPLVPGELSSLVFLRMHKKNKYFLGIKNKGLYMLDVSSGGRVYRIAPSITNPQSVCEDRFGRIWIAEGNVIWMYHPGNRMLHRFGTSYGIPVEGFSGNFEINRSGMIAIPCKNKIIQFNPSAISIKNEYYKLIPTHIESIERSKIDLTKSGTLELHESESAIAIEFSSQLYSDPTSIVYSYFIEGYQDKWIDIGSIPRIQISKMPPGNYNLRIAARNINAQLVADQFIIPIHVSPYWFNSWGFRIGLLICLLGLIVVFYQYRLSQLYRLQSLRDHIARDLHDDIGSALGAINLYASAAQHSLENNKTEKAAQILGKIGSNARETSGHMSDIIWSVNPDKDETGDLMQRIEKFAEELLEDSGYEINLHIPEELKSTTLDMQKRRNIYLILKECLHNTIKYAGGNKIQIGISKKGRKLIIQYSDNGKGFGSGKMESMNGNGMMSMKKRAAEMQAEIEIVSAEGDGMKMNLIITL